MKTRPRAFFFFRLLKAFVIWEVTPMGSHSRIRPSFLTLRVPHGKPLGRDLAHLKLLTTGLIDLPKPLLPRSSHRYSPPRAVSNIDNLVGKIILWEVSQVAI